MNDKRGRGIIFRMDGSKELGLGHISRCLNLASAVQEILAKKNLFIPQNFVLRDFEGARNFLFGTGFENSSTWIPASDDDIIAFGNIIDRSSPYVVVTDINLTGRIDEYLEAIHPTPHISLHELNFSLLQGDRIIAPTIHPLDPAPGATLGVTHFTGPDYVIISLDIIKMRESVPPPPDSPKSILITMGGADPNGLTKKILNAIRAFNDPGIDWTVVLGPASGFDKLKFVREYPAHIEYFEGAELGRSGFLEKLASSDAIITNGGTTIYETLTLGKPAIAIPQNDFERNVINQLVERNACVTPSGDGSSEILEVISRFLEDRFSRRDLADNGRKLLDGKGAQRIAEMIVSVFE